MPALRGTHPFWKPFKNVAFIALSREKRFERIFTKRQRRSEPVSGVGSTLANTENLRAALPQLISEIKARSLLDVPCGDFSWMRHTLPNLSGIKEYIGMDIVSQLVQRNNAEFGAPGVCFTVGDLTSTPLPKVDLILNRDCLIWLSFKDIRRALANIARSGSTYLLTGTWGCVGQNHDVVTGRCRHINLRKKPFLFPEPLSAIAENENGKWLGLWRISDIALPN